MPTTDRTERIAIVGIGGIFPGARDLDTFWHNIANGIDSGQSVPADRWFLRPEIALEPGGPQADRVYSDWGCFIQDFPFDPTGLNLDPALLNRLDPLFHLGLHAARAAVEDARKLSGTNLNRVGVILGNIVLPTESTSAMCRDVLGRTWIERLIEALPISPERRERLQADLDQPDRTTRDWHPLNSLAASLPAALIAEGLGLGGVAYTLDAACASSLYALKFACDELRAQRADAMLAGGMSRPDCQYTQMGFAQLQALSKRGRCAPLSAAADGLVVGEGAGLFVLKRLSDAMLAGDPIYGVIAGIGLSNDRGANLLAPHSEGQLRAMRSAYQQAGWRPSDVDLIECHATGTPVGDAVEIDSLHQLWQEESSRPGQCVIGGVKSNVGHLLTGAGAAGLMKVLYAFKHQTLPPTANYESPATGLTRPDSPFRVIGQAEPWPRRPSGRLSQHLDAAAPIPRRATINAFGFGGINAHVLIEEFLDVPHQTASPSIGGAGGPHHVMVAAHRPEAEATPENLDIAIVGLAVQTSLSETLPEFLHACTSTSNTATSNTATSNTATSSRSTSTASTKSPDSTCAQNDWGVSQTAWYQRDQGANGYPNQPAAAGLGTVRLPLGEFRIPPLEMQDMLPQQQWMLRVAAEALRDFSLGHQAQASLAAATATLGNRTGVFIGIELDPNTTNFHLRWSVEEQAPRWAEQLGLRLDPEELSAWIVSLKEAVGPPLTANRVMGNLGGIVASRLAREFNVGGPSFTISSGRNSGLRACELAAHALRRRELDQAIVGSVDLPGDVRTQIAAARSLATEIPSSTCDGATAVVLKRLEDARRDGDVVHAVIRAIRQENAPAATNPPPASPAAGAASGLLSLAAAVGSLRERLQIGSVIDYWLHNRAEGPRRMQVPGQGVDGRCLTIELEESSEPEKSLEPVHDRPLLEPTIGTSRPAVTVLPAQLLVIEGHSLDDIQTGLLQLQECLGTAPSLSLLARQWFHQQPPRFESRLAMTLIVKSREELPQLIRAALAKLRDESAAGNPDRRIIFTNQPLGSTGRMAFVFPGSGNAFVGMGRELLAAFPEAMRRQERENRWLKDQYRPELIWHSASTANLLSDHKAMIFGQVALGTALCDLLEIFGICPSASLGYSLGESAALFGLRAWLDRDEMLERMDAATLFGSDLVAPFDAARRAWNISAGTIVPWISGIIDRSADQIRQWLATSVAAAVAAGSHPLRVFLLIVNTPTQCVIGGDRQDVELLIRGLSANFVPFAAPSTVHCEVLRQVEPAYRALHLMRTTVPWLSVPAGDSRPSTRPIDFYSTAWGRPYALTSASAADAIVAQAVGTIDFPQVIHRAYADGIRLFVEIGPGASCTRMIDEILDHQPHHAQAVTPATMNPIGAFLELLGSLITHRVPVDLSPLYGDPRAIERRATDRRDGIRPDHNPAATDTNSKRQVITQVGGKPFQIPVPRAGWQFQAESSETTQVIPKPQLAAVPRSSDHAPLAPTPDRDLLPLESTINHAGGDHKVAGSKRAGDITLATEPFTPPYETHSLDTLDVSGTNVMTQLDELLTARAKAHAAYLQVSAEAHRIMAEQLERLIKLDQRPPAVVAAVVAAAVIPVKPRATPVEQVDPRVHEPVDWSAPSARDLTPVPVSVPVPVTPPKEPPRSLSRPQCMEFAIGQIGRVLGERFAAIDHYPTRVRLPDEPLMLVDRILAIDGEPLSMTSGRVVTEHDIHAGAWYLDCNRIPTCIAVEAGQADLFLSGWLGIDLETQGIACYRLLDAVVTFHRELPGPGKIIHYDIRLNHFFRQGQTYLFRFEFDATVDGEPLLTMREGCAGFFTPAELSGGKGVIHTALDRQPRPGKRTGDWRELVPMVSESYDDAQLLALRRGELAACFGAPFRSLSRQNPVTLPGLVSPPAPAAAAAADLIAPSHHSGDAVQRSRMWLIDRVLKLDPQGGKFGLGMILGELDIHPDDWFITCHFCDDQVMPGTLMYECCMHTLRVYLLRMGWVGETGEVAYEPIPGVRSRLKCRGQVLANTKKVWYEITLKEIGYDEHQTPYCLADALMYADGKPIVEITDMSVRLSGLTRSVLERCWSNPVPVAPAPPASQMSIDQTSTSTMTTPRTTSTDHQTGTHQSYDRRPALFDTDRITAFAIGNPSDAFGDRYQIFDRDRVIARLPGPPFQFLDRVVAISGCVPWVLQPGGEVVAQYDVPHDAWYFASNRQRTMPFAVLLETALQPCGWLAGYVGSALTSELDLSFRNLGGTATQFREVTAESGTLTTTVKMTRVSNSGGMIIQHYDFDLRCNDQPVYVGNTYFGFFSKASLMHQVGIRDARPFVPSPTEAAMGHQFPYVDAPPFADSQLQMIDDVQLSLANGPFGHGFIIGTTTVNPAAWFFKAHFHQDPVVPGSLGLESFFQLVKLYAAHRWQLSDAAQFATPIVQPSASGIDRKHEWVYRGQVVPADNRVTVSAVIKEVDDEKQELIAEGFLSVDGRVIYQMKSFSLGLLNR